MLNTTTEYALQALIESSRQQRKEKNKFKWLDKICAEYTPPCSFSADYLICAGEDSLEELLVNPKRHRFENDWNPTNLGEYDSKNRVYVHCQKGDDKEITYETYVDSDIPQEIIKKYVELCDYPKFKWLLRYELCHHTIIYHGCHDVVYGYVFRKLPCKCEICQQKATVESLEEPRACNCDDYCE